MSIWRGMGLQIIGGSDVPLGKPKVVKLVDCSPEYARDVIKQVGPECLVVIRTTRFDADWMKDPRGSAWAWIDWYGREWQALADEFPALCFEGVNEPADEDADAYVRWECIRLDGADCRVVVGNWSVGRPSEAVFPKYAEIFRRMGIHDFVGWHCYAGAYKHISNPWHTHRWALPAFAPYLAGQNNLVTECGADFVKDDNLPESEWGARGWKALKLTGTEYLDWLRRFGEIYADGASGPVAGACVFQTGNDPRWTDYDVRELWPRVVAEYADAAPVEPEPSGEWVRMGEPVEYPAGDERYRVTIERWEAHNGDVSGDTASG